MNHNSEPILQDIESLIQNKIRESHNLEYKSSKAVLDRDKITITVSSMSNASGGRIIYGVSEIKDKDNGSIPDKIDAISLEHINHESLEQIINNIQPRIPNIKIHPIQFGEGHFIYVVDVPMSDTAHQAMDQRYYRRYNFQNRPMLDQEIRDVMQRTTHPKVSLQFEIRYNEYSDDEGRSPKFIHYKLYPILYNEGKVLAKHIRFLFRINVTAFQKMPPNAKYVVDNAGNAYFEVDITNKDKGVLHPGLKISFEPLFHVEKSFLRRARWEEDGKEIIKWEVYCDNALPNKGEINVKQLCIDQIQE